MLVKLILLGALLPLTTPVIALLTQQLWRRPALAVAGTILLVGLPLRSGPETQATAHLSAADFGAAILVLLVGARALLSRDLSRLQGWAILPVGLVAASIVGSTAFSAGGAYPISGLIRYLEIFAIVPLAVFLAIETRRDLGLLLLSFAGLAIGEGAIGVYQYMTKTGAGFGSQAIRAVGTFGAYDIIAMSKVVAYGIAALLALALTQSRRTARLAGGATVLLLIPLGMSLSRGSWLAAAAAVTLVLLVMNWRLGVRLLAIGTVLIVLVLAISGNGGVVTRRLDSLVHTTSAPDRSVRDRYALWSASVHMWEDHPITGVGPKAFATFRDAYVGLGFSGQSAVFDRAHGFRIVQLLTPHSLYFLLLAELGAFGLLALGVLILSTLTAIVGRVMRGDSDKSRLAFLLFAFGAEVIFAISSVYGDIGGPTTVLESIVIGCVLCAASSPRIGIESSPMMLAPEGSGR